MITPAQLIGQILNAMIHAHQQGMDDSQVFSAAVTAIVAAARMSNNIDMMPQLMEQAIKSADIKAAITIH